MKLVAVTALFVLDAAKRRFSRSGFWVRAGLAFAGAVVMVHLLEPFSTFMVLGDRGPPLLLRGFDQVRDGCAFVFGTLLPEIFGIGTHAPKDFALVSALSASPPWVAAIVVPLGLITAAVFAILAIIRLPRVWRSEAAEFPLYLTMIGLAAAGAYIGFVFADRDLMLLRYNLLLLFLIVGLMSIVLLAYEQKPVRFAALAFLGALLANNVRQHAALAREYATNPPHDDYRDLADALTAHGIHVGQAGYWDAYYISFLTQEGVTLDSSERVRIPWYREAFDGAREKYSVRALGEKCDVVASVRRWAICRD